MVNFLHYVPMMTEAVIDIISQLGINRMFEYRHARKKLPQIFFSWKSIYLHSTDDRHGIECQLVNSLVWGDGFFKEECKHIPLMLKVTKSRVLEKLYRRKLCGALGRGSFSDYKCNVPRQKTQLFKRLTPLSLLLKQYLLYLHYKRIYFQKLIFICL